MANLTDNGTGRFTPKQMEPATYDLVIGKGHLGLYLQAKIGGLLGKPFDEVLLGTPLQISSGYANSEGVIKSMQNEKGFVKGLRVDLQKAHHIDDVEYVTFQVQWGTGSDGKKGGAYVGALMRTDTLFGVGDLRSALEKSYGTGTYWRVDP